MSLSLENIKEAAARFVGQLQQTPPPFSAKKVDGVPAYKLARKKQEIVLTPKQVEVKEFEILSLDGERVRFKAWVSSGTYVRSLAHELGQALGTGAHLAELTRTAVREFTLDDAHTVEELAAHSCKPCDQNDNLHNTHYQTLDMRAVADLFLHPRLVLPEFPAVTAPPEALVKVRHGAAVNLPEFSKASLVRVFEGQTRLIAIAKRVAGTLFQPKVVLM